MVRRIAPQFSDPVQYPDSLIAEFINDAVIESAYCKVPCALQTKVLAYYTAHLMNEAYGESSGGGLQKKKETVGSVSVEYHQSASSDNKGYPADQYYQKYRLMTKGYTRYSPIVTSGNVPSGGGSCGC